MTARRIFADFERLFRNVPDVLIVLLPDERFTIVEATDARLEATMTRREDIIGRGLFEMFPDNPDDPDATGVRNLRASLERVIATREPHVMAIQKYDIPRPAERGGGFEERYWSPQNTPVLDERGAVAYLIHRVEDVTAAVLAERAERQARQELRDANFRYRAVVEHVPAITYTATSADPIRILYVSPQIHELGVMPEDWQRHPAIFWRYVHPGDASRISDAWRAFRAGSGNFDEEFRFICDNGSTVWLRAQATVVTDEKGPDFVQGIVTDISDYKRVEAELRAHRDRLEDLAAERTDALQVANRRLADDIRRRQRAERALFAEKQRVEVTLNAIADAVVATDAAGRIDYLNPAAEAMLRTTQAKAIGRALIDVLPPDALSDEARTLLAASARDGRLEAELRLQRTDGSPRIIALSSTPITDNHGRAEGTVIVLADVTEQRVHQERLAYRARHDMLTGLPNREEFETRLGHAAESAGRQETHHVLLFIDLDGFKCVNDTGGHAAGDELLRQLPSVMARHIRGRDTLARIGGDEFACLLEHCSLEQGVDIARAMLAAVREYSLHWNGHEFFVGASIGIVPLDQPGINVTDALKAGDAACYAVKAGGKNNVRVQRPGEAEGTAVQQDALDRLINALGEDRFELVVQPIRRLTGTAVHAYEVLLRLVDGERRIEASAFMPLAERHRLASEIDRWVIRNTLALLAAQGDGAPVHYINISTGGLAERQLIDFIEDQLAAAALAPEKVGFEINERDLMTQFKESHEFTAAMKALGCHVALDGFASAFTLTRKLGNDAYDLIKISERLLGGAQGDDITRTLLDAANRLGHALGSATVAKCPHNGEELELARRIGFDYVQGNIVGGPQRTSAPLA